MNGAAVWAGLHRHWPRVVVALAMGVLLAAVLPGLADYPVLEWAQMRIVQPAYKLMTQGVYGNDLLAGFFNAENRDYEFMPLYPLLVTLAFRLMGVGAWQARMVSVWGGLLALALTFRLGRQIHSARLGALAAGALVILRLGLPMPSEIDRIGIDVNTTGMPLLDMARLIRFDIWVPVWVLGASIAFLWAHRRGARWGYVAAGALAGLATLTHVYGAFIMAVLALILMWEEGARAWRRPALWLMAAGWLLAMLPWATYVAGDLAAYRGQMARHGSLSDLIRPGFYLDCLLREPWRYLAWLGGSFRQPVLWPRLGIWLVPVLAGIAMVWLWRSVRAAQRPGEVLLLAAWPVLALLLGLLIHYKRYYYVVLVMPFLALQCAWAALRVWERVRAGRRGWAQALMGAALAGVLVEGAAGLAHGWQGARRATSYAGLSAQLRQSLEPGGILLLAETFWLGLHDFPARSIQLPFLLSDDRYYADPPALGEVLAGLRPDYVVSEERLLDLYARDPAQTTENAQDWRELEAYLQAHCPIVAADIVTPDYGEVKVYGCEAAGMAGGP